MCWHPVNIKQVFRDLDVAQPFRILNWNIYIFFTSTFISSTRRRRRLESRRFVCRLLHSDQTTPSATRQIEVQFKRIVFLAFLCYGEFHNSHRHSARQKAVPSFDICFACCTKTLHLDIFAILPSTVFLGNHSLEWQTASLSHSISFARTHHHHRQPSRGETSVEISTL